MGQPLGRDHLTSEQHHALAQLFTAGVCQADVERGSAGGDPFGNAGGDRCGRIVHRDGQRRDAIEWLGAPELDAQRTGMLHQLREVRWGDHPWHPAVAVVRRTARGGT